MENIISNILNNINIFFLILIRVSGIFIASPIFGRRNIPAYFKIGFAFFISLIMFFTYSFNVIIPSDTIEYMLLIIKEFIVGLVVGFVSYMVFSAILLAGQIIDTSIGFGIANVIDPLSEIQIPLIGNLLYLVMLVVFFNTDGHHLLIRGVFYSYKIVPIGKMIVNNGMSFTILDLFVNLFIIGIEISLPILLSMLIADIVLAVLSRAVPQMNVFMVGLPFKVILGLIFLVILTPFFNRMILLLCEKVPVSIYDILRGMIK